MSANSTALVTGSLPIRATLGALSAAAQPRSYATDMGSRGSGELVGLLELGEAHGQQITRREVARGRLLDERKRLFLRDARRDDHASAGFQLREQRRRHEVARGSDDDLVIRAVLRPAVVAVAYAHLDV